MPDLAKRVSTPGSLSPQRKRRKLFSVPLRQAVLLYNPISGRRPGRRREEVRRALEVLRSAGVEARALEAEGGAATAEQARNAALAGCDAVFACGGDGTAHEVLQGIVAAGAPPLALGVLPLGTGNVLANDLKVPRDPARGMRALVAGRALRIAVGRITYQSRERAPEARYFLSAAGVGADAAALYHMRLSGKRWLGQSAYYLEGFKAWVTHHFGGFEAEFKDAESGELRRQTVSQLLAVRIADFGGLLRYVAPGAALARNDFRLVVFKSRARLPYLLYAGAVALRRPWRVPRVERAYATSVECRALPETEAAEARLAPIYAEADGEVLGTLPVSISIVPDAVTLLVPRNH